MIRIENLSKTFETKEQTVRALQNVSLEVHPGEIFGIMGTSGAGKSTLVRCLNYLETPDEGGIRIEGFGQTRIRNGEVILETEKGTEKLTEKKLRKLRRNTGMIFQHFNLLDRRTAGENIAYPLRYSGKSRAEIEAKVDSLLELVGLSDKKEAYPSQLSGGQKQRVAIARALANDPQILLCDEATSALDPQATASVLSLLKTLNEKLNLTIVIITHEMEVVKKIADRAAVMEHGRVIECASAYELFQKPKEDLTRDFVSSATSQDSLKELPESVLEKLDQPDTHLLRLAFDENSVSEPVLFNVFQKRNLPFNILMANIERVSGRPFGSMLIEIRTSEDSLEELIRQLEQRHVETEVITHA